MLFRSEDTLIFDTEPSSLDLRIANILGENIRNFLIKVEYEFEDIAIDGFVGHPQISKQSRTGQYFFLNGRSIISKSLSHSIYSAYEHLLEKNLHPFFLINIKIDTRKVDVNVHPQKHEVKFEDERIIYKAINLAVLNGLQKHNLAPEITFDSAISKSPYEFIKLQSNINNSDGVLVNKMTGEIIEKNDKFYGNQQKIGRAHV